MKAVIPAAGLGTRFLPATKAQPKEMLPVYDKPTIQYVIEEAVESGVDDILIITGKGKRSIEDHFDRAFELEYILQEKGKFEYLEEVKEITDLADIHFIRQKKQKGLGDAIHWAKKHVGAEPFVVMLGDTITKAKVPCTKQLIDLYVKYGKSAIAVEPVPDEKVERYGIIDGTEIEENVYKINRLVEKPALKDAPSNLAIMGRYVLTPDIFEHIENTEPGVGGEIQLTDALKVLARQQDMYAYDFIGRRYDVGDKQGYLEAQVEYVLRREDLAGKFKEYLKTIVHK